MQKILFILAIILVLQSCCKDHSEVIPGQDFISDEILQEIQDNGQPIYEGYNPPKLDGTYIISPLTKISSNFPDNNSSTYADKFVRFFDFNPNKLTLKVSQEQGGSKGKGFGSFISGEGDSFTVYVKIENEDDRGVEYITTQVYSGIVTENGITDMTSSVFMIDDAGDPNNEYIENGQGRTFIDGDYFSPLQ